MLFIETKPICKPSEILSPSFFDQDLNVPVSIVGDKAGRAIFLCDGKLADEAYRKGCSVRMVIRQFLFNDDDEPNRFVATRDREKLKEKKKKVRSDFAFSMNFYLLKLASIVV